MHLAALGRRLYRHRLPLLTPRQLQLLQIHLPHLRSRRAHQIPHRPIGLAHCLRHRLGRDALVHGPHRSIGGHYQGDYQLEIVGPPIAVSAPFGARNPFGFYLEIGARQVVEQHDEPARFSHQPILTSSKSEKAKVWRNCPEFEKRKK